MLLTSEAVLTLANAEERMDGYGVRWIIEEFHKSEKAGCRLERVQLKSAEAIKRWAALAAPVTGNVTIHADPIGRPPGGPRSWTRGWRPDINTSATHVRRHLGFMRNRPPPPPLGYLSRPAGLVYPPRFLGAGEVPCGGTTQS